MFLIVDNKSTYNQLVLNAKLRHSSQELARYFLLLTVLSLRKSNTVGYVVIEVP